MMDLKEENKQTINDEKPIEKNIFDIYNKGVLSWYQYKKCLPAMDAEGTFYRLLDLIEDGKELLFKETDPHESKHMQSVYDFAMKALETRPDKIAETVGYKEIDQDKIPIVTLSATDAGTTECFQDDVKNTRIAFEIRQYKFHIPTLLKAHNLIYHELNSHEIIKQYNPSVDEMINNMIKKEMETITNGN